MMLIKWNMNRVRPIYWTTMNGWISEIEVSKINQRYEMPTINLLKTINIFKKLNMKKIENLIRKDGSNISLLKGKKKLNKCNEH